MNLPILILVVVLIASRGSGLGFLRFAHVGIAVMPLNTLINWAYLSRWAACRC
jgi:hypothetical protein